MEGQDQVNMNPAPTPNPAPAPQPMKPVEGGAGPVIGTIIILAVIILGGLYFWMQRSNTADTNVAPTTDTVGTDVDTSAIQAQSSADDTSSIETDLKATDTTTVDSGLNAS